MLTSGYIKVYRSILNQKWYKNKNTMALFLHLLLTANFKDSESCGVAVPRGSRLVTLKTLCLELGMSMRSVRTSLEHLKDGGQVDVVGTKSKYTLITIKNFEKFQSRETKAIAENDKRNDKRNDKSKSLEIPCFSTLASDYENEADKSTDKKNDNKDTKKRQNDIHLYKKKDIEECKEHYALTRGECSGVVDSFNSICTDLKKVRSLTDSRMDAIRSAGETVESFGGWDKLFHAVQNSDFLSGRSGNWNGCGFDWILKPDNLVRIVEGQYDNRSEPDDDRPPASYDIDEMERRLWSTEPIVYKRKEGAG